MHYCYECQKSFPRLRDVRKHERTHRLKRCEQCDCYFSSREQELKHRRDVHMKSASTQTDRQSPVRPQSPRRSAPRKRSPPAKRPRHREPRRPHDHCRRPQWRPAERTTPTPPVQPSVASVIVRPMAALEIFDSDYEL